MLLKRLIITRSLFQTNIKKVGPTSIKIHRNILRIDKIIQNSPCSTFYAFHWGTKKRKKSNQPIKIMNPKSSEKTTPRLAVTKTVRVAFIHRINMTQKLTRVKKILLTPTQILTLILTQ